MQLSIKVDCLRVIPVAPRNYKERYKEMDPDARVWHVYNDEIEFFDMINDAGGSLDILLIFVRNFLWFK